MNRLTQYALLALALISPIVTAQSQPASGFHLTAEYDRPGLAVPHWVFRIEGNGQTEYVPTYSAPQPGLSDAPVMRFTMSANGLQKLQKLLAASKGMQPCETRTKGLARMGIKSLQYDPGDGQTLKCSFNYTDNRPLAAAAEYLMATSNTLEEGVTIDRLHRYDRLGLDPVLVRLAASAKEGKAPELMAIKSSLQSLVADDQVLERVRTRASQLLALAEQQ